MTQEQLAMKADLSTTYVGQIERGLRSPTLSAMHAVAVAVDTTVHVMVEAAERTLEDD